MGSNTFFSKLASFDPLAQALHLPGAGKYMQSQTSAAAGKSADNAGPYAGVAPTLQASQAGYQPGGVGSNAGWKPFQMPTVGNGWQHFAGSQGNISPGIVGPLVDKGAPGTNIGYSSNMPATSAYVTAARNAVPQAQQRQVW